MQRPWGSKNLAMGDLRKDLCDWSFMGQERGTEEACEEGCVLLVWVSASGYWEAFAGLEAVKGRRMT